jgi:chromosomal replication initiator protein
MENPDSELRKRILMQKIQDTGLSLGNESIARILDRLRGNARDIESAVNRLYFLQSGGIELTDELLEEQLEEFLSPRMQGPLSPQIILETISEICGVPRSEILGNSRKMEIALPRHLAMYLAVHFSDLNKSAVARFFQRTDHSTVIHAERKIAMKLQKEPSFQHLFRQVSERLGINRG